MGKVGAPPKATICLEALEKEYKTAAKTLMGMGFNGTMLDRKIPKVKKEVRFLEEELQIQHIINNRLLNKDGGLYKMGLVVASLMVISEVGERMARLEKKVKAAAVLRKQTKLIKCNCEA